MVHKSFFIQAREVFSNLNRSDRETDQAIKQMTNNLDQVKRSSSPSLISTDHRA